MAELLSLLVHVPPKDDSLTADIRTLQQGSKQRNTRTSQIQPSNIKNKLDLSKKRSLDIQFRNLRYTVKDGHHKKGNLPCLVSLFLHYFPYITVQ